METEFTNRPRLSSSVLKGESRNLPLGPSRSYPARSGSAFPAESFCSSESMRSFPVDSSRSHHVESIRSDPVGSSFVHPVESSRSHLNSSISNADYAHIPARECNPRHFPLKHPGSELAGLERGNHVPHRLPSR